jgi:hypothetical protein
MIEKLLKYPSFLFLFFSGVLALIGNAFLNKIVISNILFEGILNISFSFPIFIFQGRLIFSLYLFL